MLAWPWTAGPRLPREVVVYSPRQPRPQACSGSPKMERCAPAMRPREESEACTLPGLAATWPLAFLPATDAVALLLESCAWLGSLCRVRAGCSLNLEPAPPPPSTRFLQGRV